MPKITRTNPEGISKPFSNYSHVVTAEGAQNTSFCASNSPPHPSRLRGDPGGRREMRQGEGGGYFFATKTPPGVELAESQRVRA